MLCDTNNSLHLISYPFREIGFKALFSFISSSFFCGLLIYTINIVATDTAIMATTPSKTEPQAQISSDSLDLTSNTHSNSQNQSTLTKTPPTIMSLPTELHLLISSHLTYPDALSLKHTSRHFYSFVYTGVNLKIEWLIERRTLHLDCPHDKSCELGSDLRFCRGSVRFVFPLCSLSFDLFEILFIMLVSGFHLRLEFPVALQISNHRELDSIHKIFTNSR